MCKSLKRYSTAPFIKFVIFHLCTARAINACLASLSASSFDMKNVILCIFGINLLYIGLLDIEEDVEYHHSLVVAPIPTMQEVGSRSQVRVSILATYYQCSPTPTHRVHNAILSCHTAYRRLLPAILHSDWWKWPTIYTTLLTCDGLLVKLNTSRVLSISGIWMHEWKSKWKSHSLSGWLGNIALTTAYLVWKNLTFILFFTGSMYWWWVHPWRNNL
jgi:hypothetical protein